MQPTHPPIVKPIKESKRFWRLFAVYGLVCLCVALFSNVSWKSDSMTYYRFAKEALAAGSGFPNANAIYNSCISAPVLINILIITLKIFQTPTSLLVLAVGFNLVQLYLIYRLTERFFGTKAAWIASLLYVLYLNNLGLVLLNYTELPFGCFALASLYFFTAKPRPIHFYLAGITTGLALGIRPTIVPMIGIYVLWIGINFWKNRNFQLLQYGAVLLLGVCTYVVPMGLYSKHNTGHFIYTSTTGPENLAMSSFDGATGVYNNTPFKQEAYLSKKTFIEKNTYLNERSFEWIKKHPIRWISFWPRKFKTTFTTDDIAIWQLLGGKWTLNQWQADRKLPANKQLFTQESRFFRTIFYFLQGWHQLFYLFLMGLWGYQFFYFWKNRLTTPVIVWLLNGFTVLGLVFTFVGSVGMPRYKYTYLVASIILIAPLLQRLISPRRPQIKRRINYTPGFKIATLNPLATSNINATESK